MDNGSRPEIPSIVTEDLSSTPVIHVDHYAEFVPLVLPSLDNYSRGSSDPFLLSPGLPMPNRRSIDTTGDEDGLSVAPPSPTLSTQSSVHFTTSTALRDNKPGDGSTSLALLSPGGPSRSHSRRPSNATMTSTDEGTVADHSPGISHLYPARSNATTSARSAVETLNSPTPTHVGSTSDIGEFEMRMQDHQEPKKKTGNGPQGTAEEGGDDNDDEDRPIHLDLAQDSQIDPTPFKFRPYHLASLVDPKNLDALESMSGIIGLLEGIGVNATSGLSIGGKPPQSGDSPPIVVTDPTGEKTDIPEDPAFRGTVEDRRRVYGSNVLPVRKTRTLLELMWLALKDRVLVRLALVLPLYWIRLDPRFALGPVNHCCRYLVSPWFLPRFRSRPGTREASGRLGRRCGHHCGHLHRGMCLSTITHSACAHCCLQRSWLVLSTTGKRSANSAFSTTRRRNEVSRSFVMESSI